MLTHGKNLVFHALDMSVRLTCSNDDVVFYAEGYGRIFNRKFAKKPSHNNF